MHSAGSTAAFTNALRSAPHISGRSDATHSEPLPRLRIQSVDCVPKQKKEEAEENYGGLVVALWDFSRTLFLAP